MGDRNSNIILAIIGLCMCLSAVVSTKQDCACLGPIYYYEEIGCKPVFQNPDDCCPVRYNCDNWKNLTDDQCLVNDHVYQLGEVLRPEDSNPCDNCFCSGSDRWMCIVSMCAGFSGNFQLLSRSAGKECYLKNSPFQCCPGPVVCVTKKERPTCVVDGKTYKDGEFFVPLAEPKKHCYCGKGYTGENIEPFCTLPNHTWCNNILNEIHDIRDNCIPAYDSGQSLRTDCNSLFFRCQNNNDRVINPKPTNEIQDPDMLCKFGNMTMQIGEELNRNTSRESACLRCVCEVPPVPSCQRLPSDECNPKEHGDFV